MSTHKLTLAAVAVSLLVPTADSLRVTKVSGTALGQKVGDKTTATVGRAASDQKTERRARKLLLVGQQGWCLVPHAFLCSLPNIWRAVQGKMDCLGYSGQIEIAFFPLENLDPLLLRRILGLTTVTLWPMREAVWFGNFRMIPGGRWGHHPLTADGGGYLRSFWYI